MLRIEELAGKEAEVANAYVEGVAAFLGYALPRIVHVLRYQDLTDIGINEEQIKSIIGEAAQKAVDRMEALAAGENN